MPRKISGLSGGTRVPIRGLTQLLQHLPAAARDRLSSAFSDAENLLDFYSESVRDKQNKRKLSGLLDAPILFVEQSILGASVRFDRLNDPRIAFYDIQVDDVNTFPNPETFQIVDPFFALDGISTIKHIRARGVRGATGETGNWSATVTARPTLTAPKAYSWQFYQRYSKSKPDIFKKRRFGGEDTPKFYTLVDHTFYASRLTGGMALWGMISNRLRRPLNSNVRPWDRIRFTINGLTRMENYFPLWTDSFFDTSTPNVNPVTGLPLSFYGLGGYTASFGPYNLGVPIVEHGVGPIDPRGFDDKDASGAQFYWENESLIQRPSRLDTGQLDSYDDPDHTGREALCGIGMGGSSTYLIANKFKFDIPPDEEIVGIEAKIKRRQLNYPEVPRVLLPLSKQAKRAVTPGLQFDYGYHPNKRYLEANYNQSNTLTPAVAVADIQTDVAYGRFINLMGSSLTSTVDYLGTSGLAGLPVTPQSGTVDDFNTFIAKNSWTVSAWVNPYFAGGDSQQQIWCVETYSNGTGTADKAIALYRGRIVGTVPQMLTLEVIVGAGIVFQEYTNIFVTLNKWYHIAVVYAGTNFTVYVDGVAKVPSGTSGTFPGFAAAAATFGGSFGLFQPTGFSAGIGIVNGGHGQIGVWNKALTTPEIGKLFDMRMTNDYRFNQGDYKSSANLQHYWLYLPTESQISDYEVYLTDSTGIRDDLDNKADPDLWPQLDKFFYAVTFSPDGELLARSQGIPHDNVIGIGYQTYGGSTDTWGGFFSKAAVANDKFGVAIRAKNEPRAFPGVAYVDHIKMTIFTAKPGNNDIRVKVQAEAANQFYTTREVFGALLNAIETGEIPL